MCSARAYAAAGPSRPSLACQCAPPGALAAAMISSPSDIIQAIGSMKTPPQSRYAGGGGAAAPAAGDVPVAPPVAAAAPPRGRGITMRMPPLPPPAAALGAPAAPGTYGTRVTPPPGPPPDGRWLKMTFVSLASTEPHLPQQNHLRSGTGGGTAYGGGQAASHGLPSSLLPPSCESAPAAQGAAAGVRT